MSGKIPTPYPSSKLRIIDIIVLVFFISTAILGLYLFQQDLMHTFDKRDEEPAGFLTLRSNIVQRRHEDRVLWDRIFVDSFVYPGDLIRASDFSSATIDIAHNEILLNENTLIRIQSMIDGIGTYQVELREGNISVIAGEESVGIMLNLMGNQVQAMSGSVLSAAASEEGIAVQVNEGTVEFIQEGQRREISEGAMIAFDTEGTELLNPAAVVIRPLPNARYLKSSREEIIVNFNWNRINFEPEDRLRLEVSSDINFRNNLLVLDGLINSAQAAFDTGLWHWRLMYDSSILRRGSFNIIDSSGPILISPVTGSIFRYSETLPQLRFQWAEKQEASRYIAEISETSDFNNIKISRQITSASLIISELTQGTWYWRIKPVFSQVYYGDSAYSRIGSFRIEQTTASLAAASVVEIPAASIERAREVRAETRTESLPVVRPTPVTVPARTASTVNGVNVVSTGQNYTIQAGDTLGRVARQFYGDPMLWTRITEANNIRNPDLIYPGQVFFIP
ncbi:MAG: LysM peptidoglycan-binding domain-containing protein [Treponema sp.]|nr:LysM peptidoglycan-binding domain-containing protein [Treponema sp.]